MPLKWVNMAFCVPHVRQMSQVKGVCGHKFSIFFMFLVGVSPLHHPKHQPMVTLFLLKLIHINYYYMALYRLIKGIYNPKMKEKMRREEGD